MSSGFFQETIPPHQLIPSVNVQFTRIPVIMVGLQYIYCMLLGVSRVIYRIWAHLPSQIDSLWFVLYKLSILRIAR